MNIPFKKFVVHGRNQSEFYVYVSDLASTFAQLNCPETDLQLESMRLSRALFIEQAIQEKLDKEIGNAKS